MEVEKAAMRFLQKFREKGYGRGNERNERGLRHCRERINETLSECIPP